MRSARASVLVGLLWCVALLSVVVVGVLHLATMDLRVASNHGDRIQAHYLALAGLERAKALLFADARDRRLRGQHHSGALYDAPQHFRDVEFGDGWFRVMRSAQPGEHSGVVYGVSDAESRLNANTASGEELGRLIDLAPEIAAAIIDYRDADHTAVPGGAEADYYASLQPPYLPRDGPMRTLGELLRVRGVTRNLLLGEDANGNGLLDPEEMDGDESYPTDNGDDRLDAGWSSSLTVHSSVRNTTARGEARINVQSADEADIASLPGVSQELAKAIVAHRGQNRFESIADLLEVRTPAPQQPGRPAGGGVPGGVPGGVTGRVPVGLPAGASQGEGGNRSDSSAGGGNAQQSGPPLIDERRLLELADYVTVNEAAELAGAININTAGVSVLSCLPGLDKELAQAIVNRRTSNGFFANEAGLLEVPGMTRDLFKQLAPRVTVRSDTFCILSEGEVRPSGARQRIQVVVRVGSSDVTTLAYREVL